MKLTTLLFLNIMIIPLMAQQKDAFIAYDEFPVIFTNLPTIAANSVEFPINKKFTIKLHTTDSIYFDYSVIRFERFNRPVNYDNLPAYFTKEDTTKEHIELYFTVGSGSDKRGGVIWVMKNWTDFDLAYDIEIQESFITKTYKPASNKGVGAGSIAIEKWHLMLNYMRLSNIRIKEHPKK